MENCQFDGTVTTAITADSSDEDKEIYQYVYIAGIAGDVTYGEIRDCTARGLISGYGSEMGGIAAYVSNSEVTGCVNEATVENSYSGDTGGIVGRMVYSGIIRDCRNKGKVICRSSAGIVSNVESKDGQVIRCWNEGDIEGSYGSGIVLALKGSVKNCYNTGSVDEAGIVGTAYSGSSVTYCHNVGEITGHLGESICSISSGSNITIENCYYLADSETDSVDGTTYKTAAQFADGTVLALLNSGENAGNWKQGDGYPVLGEIPGVTVSGSAVSWNDTDDAVYLLYSGSTEDSVIKSEWVAGSFNALYTATKGSITDATVDGKAMKAQTFTFGEVEAGSYKLVILKLGKYVPKIIEITVEDTDSDSGQHKLWLYGDVTGDGKIRTGDATQIYKYLADERTFTADEFAAADVTGDEKIRTGDATQIYKYLAEETSKFDEYK